MIITFFFFFFCQKLIQIYDHSWTFSQLWLIITCLKVQLIQMYDQIVSKKKRVQIWNMFIGAENYTIYELHLVICACLSTVIVGFIQWGFVEKVWFTYSTFLAVISFCFNEKLPHHPLTERKVEIKTHYHLPLYI